MSTTPVQGEEAQGNDDISRVNPTAGAPTLNTDPKKSSKGQPGPNVTRIGVGVFSAGRLE
jgi:hypothetical protein